MSFFGMILALAAFQACGHLDSPSGLAGSQNLPSGTPQPAPDPSPSPASPAPLPQPTPQLKNRLEDYVSQNLNASDSCVTAEGLRVPLGTFAAPYWSNATGASNWSQHPFDSALLQQGITRLPVNRCDLNLHAVVCSKASTNCAGSASTLPAWYPHSLALKCTPTAAPALSGQNFVGNSQSFLGTLTGVSGICFELPNRALEPLVCSGRGCLPSVSNPRATLAAGTALDPGQAAQFTITNSTGAQFSDYKVEVNFALKLLQNNCDRAKFSPGESCQIIIAPADNLDAARAYSINNGRCSVAGRGSGFPGWIVQSSSISETAFYPLISGVSGLCVLENL